MTQKTEPEVVYVQQAPSLQEDEIDLGDMLGVLAEQRWLILAVALLVTLAGVAYALIARPVYSADALLQVEEKKGGLDSLDLSALLEGSASVTAEIELLRSRLVLGKAIDTLRLDVLAEPAYLPVIGRAVARRHDPRAGLAEPWLGLAGYPWGGERIELASFDVPAHWLGKRLTLIAGEGGTYQLLDPERAPLAKGRAGERLEVALGGAEPLVLYVAALQARPGTAFHLQRQPRLEAIAALQARLKVSEKGKQSGILALSLEGEDAERVRRTTNEIANIYVRQNVERKSAEAEQTLAFLEQQLPEVKQRLEAAEVALNAFRLEQGSVDLPLETQGLLQKIVSIEGQLVGLRQKRDEATQRFTAAHPTVVALDAQIARFSREMEALNRRVKALPDTQQEVLRLTRDVQVNTALYTALLNSAQELRVVKAGTIGNVRVVDYAELPYQPIKPRKALVAAVAVVLGLFLGVLAAFLRRALRGGVEDPDLVEKQVGIPVYATVPHSKAQVRLTKRIKARTGRNAVLASEQAEDAAVESLRSLRTTLHFALIEARNNIIMITGPSPAVGKSFISINLGAVLASAGKRVLLVDADLRKGHLNQYLGLGREAGLSGLISGRLTLEQAIHRTPVEGLDLMPTGAIPPNPSELLLHERFAASLAELAERYDHILIDSPPVLAVTDAAIVGRVAGAALMVVKAGAHPMREIEYSVKRLKQAGVNLRGLLFNDVNIASRRYGAGKYAYQYAYRQG